MKTSRRKFIKSAGIGLALSSYPGFLGSYANEIQSTANESDEKLKLGLASYTFKEFSLDQAIAMTNRVGLKYIALKSFHLPMESTKEEITAAAAKVRAGGLDLYGCSVVVLTNENEVNQAFEYAKTAQMPMIIAQPVGELLNLLERKVKEYDIKLAIHNHGPEDHNFPSPIETMYKIKKMDPRIGLSIDVGHVRRSGIDPSDCIKKCADRLMDIHIKDLKTIQLVSDVCEVGRGKLDIPGILRTLINIKFKGIVAFEYEKDLNDPLAGLAESVGYTRGVLRMI
jgi:inosose dehydratase